MHTGAFNICSKHESKYRDFSEEDRSVTVKITTNSKGKNCCTTAEEANQEHFICKST